jgi:hypothetical protein
MSQQTPPAESTAAQKRSGIAAFAAMTKGRAARIRQTADHFSHQYRIHTSPVMAGPDPAILFDAARWPEEDSRIDSISVTVYFIVSSGGWKKVHMFSIK